MNTQREPTENEKYMASVFGEAKAICEGMGIDPTDGSDSADKGDFNVLITATDKGILIVLGEADEIKGTMIVDQNSFNYTFGSRKVDWIVDDDGNFKNAQGEDVHADDPSFLQPTDLDIVKPIVSGFYSQVRAVASLPDAGKPVAEILDTLQGGTEQPPKFDDGDGGGGGSLLDMFDNDDFGW